ncbi:zinc finger protein 654-like [Centropristis striata]|uniref:zinc finger protein 654-like n=1 Tax=Centropristis striata TaxID=184440 RepID=UPI0027E20438|nr:zinc finger protein 654-like [Centropristis striata]
MADSESDVETDGLDAALDALRAQRCSGESPPNSKLYCSGFCRLVEEYTGQWQVPLPQLKVLRTALCSFTKATAVFPEDCQHIHYVLSSMALSFFELMLFFSKEEFVEEPLKDILDSFQECHSQLLRHRNIYLQHVRLIIKAGGPWENPVLKGVLQEADLSPKEVEDYLSSELPVFFELRIRYLQACERMQEAMALAKSCLENREAGRHLYFHQAYLTCLYKASLHEHLHKEMAEIDGRDAVEIICNTESVEKDELLLSLCKAFLTQQLHNGDMYYIWDLVFIWSRLHLRAHPSRNGFLSECLQLASSATNVRAIFPFIKLVTTELGVEGVQVCVELCSRALQLSDLQADSVTRSLVCKTIAFLLPHDLEICRACSLLVFCQERSLEAYRTVCLLYMHPDQEPHPHNSPVRTNVRFHILQMLKERLCFDPEFWNLLTIRTHCLELMSDKVMKAAVLSEMEEEEELLISKCVNDSCTQGFTYCRCSETAFMTRDLPEETPPAAVETETVLGPSNNDVLKRRRWRKSLRRRNQSVSDEEADLGDDDPEFKYNLKTASLGNKPVYSLRRNHTNKENSASVKAPLNRKREYLSRCVKSQILKRKGRKKRWLQGLPRLEPLQTDQEKKKKAGVKDMKVKVNGKKRGRKPFSKLELSFPDNEVSVTQEEESGFSGFEDVSEPEEKEPDMPHLENELEQTRDQTENRFEQMDHLEKESELEKHPDLVSSGGLEKEPEAETLSPPAAVEADPELDGQPLELLDCPVEVFHSYSLKSKTPDSEKPEPAESWSVDEEVNGDTELDLQPAERSEESSTEVKAKRSWRDRVLRTQQYAHLRHHCSFCRKDYKGLNVMRHALSHLKSRKLRCILCGKRFKQLPFAKKHVLDHIDEMCKQKAPEAEPSPPDPPAANGIIVKVEDQGQSQPQGENQTPVPCEKPPEQKPAGKTKVSSLKREDRIIRNLRTLIKKTSVLHKKCKNPDANIFKQVDFKDEQVVIKDGLVIVKDPSVVEKEAEGEQEEEEEKPAGENGYGVDITYHLCPSESCDRVFLRISTTLTKHAIKCHINEEKVLEKTFVWAKHKCTLCLRQIQFLQHYKDHMKLHDTSLQHFCYHLECRQRFSTQQELKDHVGTHKPFRPQCPFTECEKLFPSLQSLYDHEWRHYIPAPQREELESGLSRQMPQNPEAPWKQRVKVEEIWLQSKKGPRESPDLDQDPGDLREMKPEDQPCETSLPDRNQDLFKPETCPEETDTPQPSDQGKTAINGHENQTRNQEPDGKTSSSPPGAAAAPRKGKASRRRIPVEYDPLNVRDLEEMSTMSEGVQQKLGEPHITEHKTFKPEDPSYATFVKAPFIRPPPSTYLDEARLSMRKRRTTEEVAPKKNAYWSNKKKKDPAVPEKLQTVEKEASEQKVRQRCDKCLSSFSSVEELHKHQQLNTCSSLFGFDSDDET